MKNWLKQPQRFNVKIEPENMDSSVTFSGLDYIDVPANVEKFYKLNFYSYKEGTFFAKVTLTNISTGEYLYFTLAFLVKPSAVLETIELETPVRKSITHTITLHNPLNIPAIFNIICDCDKIMVPPSVSIPPGYVFYKFMSNFM